MDDGLKINYHLDGEAGPVILILNGIMMSTASWADLFHYILEMIIEFYGLILETRVYQVVILKIQD